MKLLNLADCTSNHCFARDAAQYDWGQKWVSFLPDGRHFLFAGLRIDRQHDVRLGTLGSPASECSCVMPRIRDTWSLATSFSPARVSCLLSPSAWTSCSVEGDPTQVVPQQLNYGGFGGLPAMTSPAREHSFTRSRQISAQTVSGGCLRYANGNAGPGKRLTGPRMLGRRKEVADKIRLTSGTYLRPMGYDLEHRNWERVSFEASKGEHRGLWSRDGTNIVYAAAVNAKWISTGLPPYLPTRRKFC